jgi:hypothetical protein
MRPRRFGFFFLTILIGIGAGLAFGWLVMPPKPAQNANFERLRVDYQTDLVLMLAEAFQKEADSLFTLSELAKISQADPMTLIGNSLYYAQQVGYPQEDLALFSNLLTGIDLLVYQEWIEQNGSN